MIGLHQACRCKVGTSSKAAKVSIRAKSLNCNFGNVYTWPHSHYQIRQFNGVSGWKKMRIRYKLCRCKCKIDNLVKKKTGFLISFILLAFKLFFTFLNIIRFPHLLSSFFSYLVHLGFSTRLAIASDPSLLQLLLPRNCLDILDFC